MTDAPRSTDTAPETTDDPLDGEGGGEGVELTTGEPSTFEPEEDPDAAE